MAVPACRITIGTTIQKSNHPATKQKAMKQNNRFPGLAALALLGIVMVGCTSVSVEVLPQPEDTGGVIP